MIAELVPSNWIINSWVCPKSMNKLSVGCFELLTVSGEGENVGFEDRFLDRLIFRMKLSREWLRNRRFESYRPYKSK